MNTRGLAWHRKYEQTSLEFFNQEKAAEAIPTTFQCKAYGQHTRGRSCGQKFQQPTRPRSLSLEYQTLRDSIPSLQEGALDKAMGFQAQLAESQEELARTQSLVTAMEKRLVNKAGSLLLNSSAQKKLLLSNRTPVSDAALRRHGNVLSVVPSARWKP